MADGPIRRALMALLYGSQPAQPSLDAPQPSGMTPRARATAADLPLMLANFPNILPMKAPPIQGFQTPNETPDNAAAENAIVNRLLGRGRDLQLPKDTDAERETVEHDPNDPAQMTEIDRRYAIDRDWRERDSPEAQKRNATRQKR